MRYSFILRITTLCILFSILAISITGCEADNTVQVGKGGFFNGLIAPLSLIPVVVSGLFDSRGIDKFHQHWASTWGQGSLSYRFGFVVGIIILIVLVGGIGSGVSAAHAKENSQ